MLGAVFVLQLVLGALNVALKAPVPLQLLHLLISDVIWIALVLLAANALAVDVAAPALNDAPSRPASLAERTV
jgi:heme A synthase